MSDTNERSVASAGSVEPAAWEVYWEGAARVPYLVSANEKPSDQWEPPPRCVPLYRSPTLTDDERAAVAWAAKQMQYIRADNAAATLRGLLERLRPQS